MRYDNPREVGADRLVNSVAAFYKYGGPCVSVDLGTTINFDIVSAKARIFGRHHLSGHRHVDRRIIREAPRVCRWSIFASRKS